MCRVVGAIRDRADDAERTRKIVAHLRDRRAFHFDGQRVGQQRAQRVALGPRGDEAIAADDQTLVHGRGGRMRAERSQRAAGLRESRRPGRIRIETRAAGERHLPAREQRLGVHVVLQQRGGNDDVADAHAIAEPAGDAGQQQRAGVEGVEQHGRGGGRGNLADPAAHEDHVVAVEAAEMEVAARAALGAQVGEARPQRGDLFVHRADDGQARHAITGMLTRWRPAACGSAQRNPRHAPFEVARRTRAPRPACRRGRRSPRSSGSGDIP